MVDRCQIETGRMTNTNCEHEKGIIIAQESVEGERWRLYKCENCGDGVLSTGAKLEQCEPKAVIPKEQFLAYAMHDLHDPP